MISTSWKSATEHLPPSTVQWRGSSPILPKHDHLEIGSIQQVSVRTAQYSLVTQHGLGRNQQLTVVKHRLASQAPAAFVEVLYIDQRAQGLNVRPDLVEIRGSREEDIFMAMKNFFT
jgi:hypothetical protein